LLTRSCIARIRAACEPTPEAVERREGARPGGEARERLPGCLQPGAETGEEGFRAREVAIDDGLADGHHSFAGSGPEEEVRPGVEAVLPRDVAASPGGQPILRRRALAEGSGVGVDPGCRRRQTAPPASSDTPDPEVDILEVGEERRVEAADLQECGPIERRGAAARREGVERASLQHLQRLAVQVVEPVQGSVDDDARGVDPVLVAEPHENR
jgi:hypothetical protein